MNKRTLTSADYLQKMEARKERIAHLSDGLPRREFLPLRSWPAAAHPEQHRLNQYAQIPSRNPK